jgi:hypothetical protein
LGGIAGRFSNHFSGPAVLQDFSDPAGQFFQAEGFPDEAVVAAVQQLLLIIRSSGYSFRVFSNPCHASPG